MIIYNFNIFDIASTPFKAYSPTIIDSTAVLTLSTPRQLFQSIRRRNTQIIQGLGIVQHAQLSQRRLLDFGRQLARTLAPINLLGLDILERFDHTTSI